MSQSLSAEQLRARLAEVEHSREHFEAERAAYLEEHDRKMEELEGRAAGFFFVVGELQQLIAAAEAPPPTPPPAAPHRSRRRRR